MNYLSSLVPLLPPPPLTWSPSLKKTASLDFYRDLLLDLARGDKEEVPSSGSFQAA